MGEVGLPAQARRILELARRDRDEAKRALAALSVDEQVALVCETPVSRRGELMDLLPHPEAVVPRMPEAELCFTVKAIGLGDAAWLLAHATDDQMRAAIDLDAWRDDTPDTKQLGEWIGALREAGDEALLRAAHALDPELWMLWLADRVEVFLAPSASEDPGWEPPEGSRTLEGQFYLRARRSNDDLEDALRLLTLLFENDYWLYFRLLQSVSWESVAENEEFALRWRTGRLQDLGFPPRMEAIEIYAAPRRDELERLPEAPPAAAGEWHLPVWMPDLPESVDRSLPLFRAAAELDDDARRRFFYAFVALANKVAVADRLPLGDADSLPRAIDKAARVASAGLEVLAERHGLPLAEVLRRAPLVRLFRIGARLDPARTAP